MTDERPTSGGEAYIPIEGVHRLESMRKWRETLRRLADEAEASE